MCKLYPEKSCSGNSSSGTGSCASNGTDCSCFHFPYRKAAPPKIPENHVSTLLSEEHADPLEMVQVGG